MRNRAIISISHEDDDFQDPTPCPKPTGGRPKLQTIFRSINTNRLNACYVADTVLGAAVTGEKTHALRGLHPAEEMDIKQMIKQIIP